MYKEYCTGCGLCSAICQAELEKDNKGFRVIKEERGYEHLLSQLCPVNGKQCDMLDGKDIWGRTLGTYLAYSSDPEIRHLASSGGVLSSLCLYLLNNKLVDGIVHTGVRPDNPIDTQTFLSVTRQEVIAHCGSRYSSSSPLMCIKEYLESGKKYAYIGKPCEITALRNYSKIDTRVDNAFPYMFSFFCAGAPSENANYALLNKMGVDPEACVSLRYRGDGWPGYATAVDKSGNSHKLDYRTAWRDTLGRDIRKICRFCLDGIGEQADISACDAWYLDDNMQPVFEEAEGRNAVFCRNDKGLKLYSEAVKAGYIVSSDYRNYKEELQHSQSYQYQRRATMGSAILAMKLNHRQIPKYNKKLVKDYGRFSGVEMKLSVFKGTLSRIRTGKI